MYYTLSSHDIDTHGRVCRYNPETDSIDLFADLGEITGYAGQKSSPWQIPFADFRNRRLYIYSHPLWLLPGQRREGGTGSAPEGYEPYPGGRIIE